MALNFIWKILVYLKKHEYTNNILLIYNKQNNYPTKNTAYLSNILLPQTLLDSILNLCISYRKQISLNTCNKENTKKKNITSLLINQYSILNRCHQKWRTNANWKEWVSVRHNSVNVLRFIWTKRLCIFLWNYYHQATLALLVCKCYGRIW
jgi:ABC-type Fe3+-citrate transport system substrate-binding protein